MTRWCLHTICVTCASDGSQGSVEIAFFSDSISYYFSSFYARTMLAFFFSSGFEHTKSAPISTPLYLSFLLPGVLYLLISAGCFFSFKTHSIFTSSKKTSLTFYSKLGLQLQVLSILSP